ncbi:MAG: hypothetical protein C0467_02920 [Planctomycetaceae bacterium]|nr:hypothetical protein [Planctomycetaceae bacterium]
MAVALAVGTNAFAQSPPLAAGRPGGVLPTDALFAPAPAVPPRTAFQPARQPAGVPDQPDFTLPDGSVLPIPQGKSQQFRFTRRYGTPNTLDSQVLPDGTRRFVFTGGVIVNATGEDGQETEFATDDAVVWVRGLAIDNIQNGFQSSPDRKTEVESYLAGNVIVRTKTKDGPLQTLRASEVYYDMQRERAVALSASLEFTPEQITQPVRLRGQELRRLDRENWEALQASFDGSSLPSDPGLRFDSRRVTMSEQKVLLRNAFGIPFRDLLTGEKVEGSEKMMTAYGAIPKIAGVPVFYLPRLRLDATDPLGPFVGFSAGQSQMFGTSAYTTWDMFDLLALKPPPGQKWRLNADYMSARGAALGTDYTYNVPVREPGLLAPIGQVKLYGLKDHGIDLLGGDRGPEPTQPSYRGRADWRHQQEIIEGLYYQGQVAYLSDKNFLEEYYKQEFDLGANHETFSYLTYQKRNYMAAGLLEYRLDRPWVAETQWLPRLDGYVTGQTFLNDLFVYSGHANAGYALARPSTINPTSVLSTDQKVDTGRFDLMQELSVPLALGPVKFAPYGTVDLTGYTEDLNGNSVGRVWGGGGARATLPLTRLYENATSDLFNVRGINHKVVFGANYLYARSNVPFSQLPLLDRLNDDATDQSWRNITPMQPTLVAGPNGTLLATGGDPTSQFNPQRYLIRRGATNRVDSIDNINVLQADVRQRFQTKRGYPGMEHTVDMFTLDVSASYLPESSRDNFGNPFAFLEYDALWNIGDRTALMSSGWFEPYSTGSRYYTFGAAMSRPDRTNFYLGYRQTDPINSRAVTGSVGYQLSQRYFMNLAASYDFGINQALSNSFYITRTGSDLTFSLGVTYNSLQNNLGVQFMVMPNLMAAFTPGRFAGAPINGNNANSTSGRGR